MLNISDVNIGLVLAGILLAIIIYVLSRYS